MVIKKILKVKFSRYLKNKIVELLGIFIVDKSFINIYYYIFKIVDLIVNSVVFFFQRGIKIMLFQRYILINKNEFIVIIKLKYK